MILKRVRELFARHSRAEQLELVIVLGQIPVVIVALILGQLTRGSAIVPLLLLIEVVVSLVLLAILHRVHERRRWARARTSRVITPVPGVIGRTAATRGWGELENGPGSYRGYLETLAELASVEHIAEAGLQTDAPAVYDALALKATAGRFDVASLTEAAGGIDHDDRRLRIVLGDLDLGALVALARVMQAHRHPGVPAIVDLCFALRDRSHSDERLLLAQILLLEGRPVEAEAVLSELPEASWNRDRLASDLLNPFTGAGGSVEAWAAVVNGFYRASGLEPIVISDDPSGEPFDRLTASSPIGRDVDGPLVTVIMSTFEPGRAATTAAESILRQSWRNLELLVMDDASGPEYDAALDALAALDTRVKVHRATENAGTYVRRNEGIRLARGEFVTMQDSDDWSHPRRLELQLRHLGAHPELPANLVSALRVSRELLFAQPRGLHLRLAEPSLMFRRELVVDRIGYFDSVRRSADSEYRVRIARVFGSDIPVLDLGAPLMLMRFDRESLSGSDLGDGWTHPARLAYRSAYLRWGARKLRSGETPRIEFPLAERPFPAPARLTGEEAAAPRLRLLVVGDGRAKLSDDPSVGRIVTALRGAGLAPDEVGYLQVSSLQSVEPQLLADGIQDLILDGQVTQVHLGDDVAADLVVVAHPSVALGLPRGHGTVRAGRVVAIADPEVAADSLGRAYAVGAVEEACERHFSVRPAWRALRAREQIDLRALLDETGSEAS